VTGFAWDSSVVLQVKLFEERSILWAEVGAGGLASSNGIRHNLGDAFTEEVEATGVICGSAFEEGAQVSHGGGMEARTRVDAPIMIWRCI
jgi:hypothetical protein